MIAITMGDPSGVGPEIILKAYEKREIIGDFLVIGDASVLELCIEKLNMNIDFNIINSPAEAQNGCFNLIDMKLINKETLVIGSVNKESGYAAYQYVAYAAKLAINKTIDAIVTLPINKEAVRLTYSNFSGHTELLADMCNEQNYTMMLTSTALTVTHVNTHVSMTEAVKNTTKEKVYNTILLTYSTLQKYIDKPRIAVAGLNAHAGENGSFGVEDINEIKPAVEKAVESGIYAEGPIPPDTVFLKAVNGQYDCVVCMYHDQGHIPMKLLDFDGGVNVTLGLPVIRTSVDHGTAFDIAYKGIAKTKSFVEAFHYAEKLIGSH